MYPLYDIPGRRPEATGSREAIRFHRWFLALLAAALAILLLALLCPPAQALSAFV